MKFNSTCAYLSILSLLSASILDLQLAAAENDLEAVDRFLKAGNVDPSGKALALIAACRNGHASIVSSLLADSGLIDGTSIIKSLLHAVENGHLAVLKLFLEDETVNSNIDDTTSLLAVAIKKEHLEIVDLLLQHGKAKPTLEMIDEIIFVNTRGCNILFELTLDKNFNRENRAIINASKKGHAGVVALLLKDTRVDPSGESDEAIINASMYGHLEVVELLLKDQRVDPSVKENSALSLASRGGYIDIVKVLLQDPRVSSGGNDKSWAVINASIYGHVNVVDLLLEDPNVDPSAQQNLAIIEASRKGLLDVVDLLLQDSRVDPSKPDNQAIVEASSAGHANIVELLLKDPRVDPSGRKNLAFLKASEEGHVEVLKLLLKDTRFTLSKFDNAAFSIAAKGGHVEVIKFLLTDNRFDPSGMKNKAVVIASMEGHAEVVDLLLKDPRVTPSISDNISIVIASAEGHADVVKLLLKDTRVDPSAMDNLAIICALGEGHDNVVELLIEDPRLASFKQEHWETIKGSPEGRAKVVESLLESRPAVTSEANSKRANQTAIEREVKEIRKGARIPAARNYGLGKIVERFLVEAEAEVESKRDENRDDPTMPVTESPKERAVNNAKQPALIDSRKPLEVEKENSLVLDINADEEKKEAATIAKDNASGEGSGNTTSIKIDVSDDKKKAIKKEEVDLTKVESTAVSTKKLASDRPASIPEQKPAIISHDEQNQSATSRKDNHVAVRNKKDAETPADKKDRPIGEHGNDSAAAATPHIILIILAVIFVL